MARHRVVCWEEDAEALATAAEAWRQHSREAERPWREWVRAAGQEASEREERARQATAERRRRIDTGEWVFSRADLLRRELALLITERGWDRKRWRPVPSGADGRPGRPWGGSARGFDAAVHVDLPTRHDRLIRRVAYWTSERAVRELQQFVDRHGRGPAQVADLPPAVQLLGLAAMAARMPSATELSARDYWKRQVVTVGDILREVIARAGHRSPPEAR